MTNDMIYEATKKAERLSRMFGVAWLLSNGEELKAVAKETEKYFYTAEKNGFGYWVVSVYENGHIVYA